MRNSSRTRRILVIIASVIMLLVSVAVIYALSRANELPFASSGGAFVLKDVRYCGANNSSQEYDLYIPKESPIEGAPIVVHVHGGGWQSGGKSNGIADHYAEQLTARGIAFASVDYRLANEAVYPAQNDDVQCAVEHLQANASKYGINGENVIMMGDSAGGHLAALEGLDATNDHVQGVIMLYGVSDLWVQITDYKDSNAIHYLGKRDELLAKKASPFYQTLSDAPPFLMIHGTNDAIVPASESMRFAERLKSQGRDATYVPVDGAGHAFADNASEHEQLARKHAVSFIERIFQRSP